MAILDIFKKKKKPPKALTPEGKKKKEALKESKAIKREREKEPKKIPTAEKPRIKKRKRLVQAYKVLKIPHITEKSTDLTKENKYIFRVWPETNKTEIKKTIEDLYDVDVVSVRIINIPPKRRRLGRTLGWRKGYKKAIVKIKKGQKIEALPR